MSRIILHLDMNSYFASVEQQANPLLRGRPVGVCEHLGGIIIAPSVEAKRVGIVLGTPVWDALKICPGIVLLPTDPDKYRAVTERFMRILSDYSDDVERYSIDEAFVDISRYCSGDWNDALLLGLQIKQRLRQEVGEWVSCSVGIGPNKLTAKIAADLDGGVIAIRQRAEKQSRGHEIASSSTPRNDKQLLDRICVVRPEDIESLYGRLDLTDIPGIGKRLERSLHKLGIFTLRQLRDYPVANLIVQFGINGYWLHRLGNMEDDGIVVAAPDLPKSVGHAYTLPRVINNLREIRGLMMKLAEKVGRRMRRQGARGNLVHYFHSDRQYDSFYKQKKLGDFISGGREIYGAVFPLFSKERVRVSSGIKIMGITISGLVFDRPPEPLFPQFKKIALAARAMDRVNDKYGDWTVYPGRILGVPDEWGQDTVGFARLAEDGESRRGRTRS